jgi:hypothetical protein
MRRKNKLSLADRVSNAAAAALADQHHVNPVNLLVDIGWLDPGAMQRWRRGEIECLEATMRVRPERLAEALTLLRSWATERGLTSSPIDYVARTPQRQALRFSRSGDPAIEAAYRTHWISGALADRQRERVVERAGRPPELVVVDPLNGAWTCHRCGGTGAFLLMENPGPACLDCVGLGDLEFLPSGDPLLTRRAKAKSARWAVVVRFSKTRRRYERQGLLVEPQALASTQAELEGRRLG